ncbi:MAG: glycosyltransferase family 2 protein [Phycisphaerales bacterium JB041]
MSAGAATGSGPDVSVIVVSYGTREMTLACLRSVFAETIRVTFEVLVVDNQSPDGSANAIDAEFGDRVRLMRADSNLGFAAANNFAASEARGKYLLLLNPDTIILDRAIDNLVAFAGDRPAGRVWGGRTVFADKSLNPGSCWRRMTLWGLLCRATGLTRALASNALFNPEEYGGWRRNCVRHVDIVSGCFLLIEHSLWDALGGFNPEFFMYGEDADLCLRAHRLGARPIVTPSATIVHYGGASEKARADKLVRLLSAKTTLIRHHMPGPRQRIGMMLLAAWPLTRAIAQSVLLRVRRPSGSSVERSWIEAWQRRGEWLTWGR